MSYENFLAVGLASSVASFKSRKWRKRKRQMIGAGLLTGIIIAIFLFYF